MQQKSKPQANITAAHQSAAACARPAAQQTLQWQGKGADIVTN